MATISKPVTGAVVLDGNKLNAFLSDKSGSSKKALERIETRIKKSVRVAPVKK